MNQAVAVDLSQEDLSRLRSAFDFCQLLADGIYRAQGIPLLNHLVRTASIVLNQTNSVDVVITALLHAAFVVDKFDHSTRTPDLEIKRKDIRRLFGNEIEHLLLAYEKMAWYHKKALQHYLQVHASLSQEMKNLLLIRLANELEDHLDFAMAYTAFEGGTQKPRLRLGMRQPGQSTGIRCNSRQPERDIDRTTGCQNTRSASHHLQPGLPVQPAALADEFAATRQECTGTPRKETPGQALAYPGQIRDRTTPNVITQTGAVHHPRASGIPETRSALQVLGPVRKVFSPSAIQVSAY